MKSASRPTCGLAAALLALAPTSLPALEIAGSLLIDLEAADYTTGALTWPQNSVTALPGLFYPTGTPTAQTVAGASAVVFDGKAEYFAGPLTTGTSLEAAGGPYSVEAWAYQGDVRWEECLASWSQRGGPDGSFAGFRYGRYWEWGAWAGWGGAGDMGFAPRKADPNDEGTFPAAGTWHLITYTYDGTTKRIYVDGVLNTSEPGALDAKNGNTILIGTEREGDGIITGNDQIFFSGAIAKVRIHSGTLSDTQVAANFAEETPAFPGLAAAASIPRPPLHRWSFNNPAGGAPDNTALLDSIGGATAVIRGGTAYTGTDATFTGTAVSLPGGSSASQPYVDLPNGMISAHPAITIEFWATSLANRNWSRLLDLGTSITGNTGEITGPGGGFGDKRGLWLTNNIGTGTDQEFNREGGASPNGGLQRGTVRSTVTGTQAHHAIVYDAVLKEWRWYRDAALMAVIPDTEGPTDILDHNNWFGRSGWSGDENFQGELNEFRIYNYALTQPQIYRNILDGPDTLTTAISPTSLVWTPTAAGPFNFDNAGAQDNWNTGAGGPFPNAVDATANLVSNLTANQEIPLNVPVTLGDLNVGDPDGSNSFKLSPGAAGALRMDVSSGNASIIQAAGAFDTTIAAPVTLTSDTIVSNATNNYLYLAAPITGTGDLIKTGIGPVYLTADSLAYGGEVSVINGNLFLGDNGTAGLIYASAFRTTLPGRLIMNRSDNVVVPPVVTGTGSVEHRGAGSLTLTTGTSLTHTWDFDVADDAGPFTIDGTAFVSGPRNFRIDNDNTLLAGNCDINIGTWFSVGITDGGTCTMRENASLDTDGDFNVGDVGIGDSTFLLESGTVECGNLFLGKNAGTSGVLTQTGGTFTKVGGGEARVGGNVANLWGAYRLLGGSFANNAGNYQVGPSGYGSMEIDGGATATSVGWVALGRFDGAYGMMDVRSGSFSQTGVGNRLIVGENGYGTLNIRGTGTVTCLGGVWVGHGSDADPGFGTVNLWTGGTLNTTFVNGHTGTALSNGKLNFHGGTLQANQDNATFLNGIDGAYVYQEGATIHTNGFNVTIPQALSAPTGDGVATIPVTDGGTGYAAAPLIEVTGGGGDGATAVANVTAGVVTSITVTNPGTGYTSAPTVNILGGGAGFGLTLGTPTLTANTSGGLAKTGGGTLTLGGTNTYTGTTKVTAGRLDVTGSLAGPADVTTSSTLGGTGSIAGAVTVDATSNLAPGTSVGTLTAGSNVTLAGTLQVEVDGVAGTADRLDVAGTLNITGAALNVTQSTPADDLVYVIATYGTLVGNPFSPENIPAGYQVNYNYNGEKKIALVAAATDYDTWAGIYSLDPAGAGAPGLDADNDGLTNGDEYAFGLNPTRGTSVSPVTTGLTTGGTFTYTRRDDALTGLVYQVYTSTDLATWTPDPTASQAAGAVGPAPEFVETVTVTVTATPVGGKLFARVVASPPLVP